MPTPAVQAARRLAALLDAADFGGAAALLHPDCVYLFRATTIRGRDAIIASYERAHADAVRTFGGGDSIEYESDVRVDPNAPNAAVIHYTDIITCRGVTHRHHCEQRITIEPTSPPPASSPPALITRIEHVDLPGEHDALNAFLAKVGLPTRPALAT